MCNSPATFQSMIDAIFSDMIDDNLVIIYMDHGPLTKQMMEILTYNLQHNPKKLSQVLSHWTTIMHFQKNQTVERT